MLTLYFGGGPQLEVPCRGILLARVERGKGKTETAPVRFTRGIENSKPRQTPVILYLTAYVMHHTG